MILIMWVRIHSYAHLISLVQRSEISSIGERMLRFGSVANQIVLFSTRLMKVVYLIARKVRFGRNTLNFLELFLDC